MRSVVLEITFIIHDITPPNKRNGMTIEPIFRRNADSKIFKSTLQNRAFPVIRRVGVLLNRLISSPVSSGRSSLSIEKATPPIPPRGRFLCVAFPADTKLKRTINFYVKVTLHN